MRTTDAQTKHAADLGSVSTKERILAVAGGLFARKGIHETSLGDIAEASGVSKGTLYYHYKSKDELLYELVDRDFTRLTDSIARLLEEEAKKIDPGASKRERAERFLALALRAVLAEEDLSRRGFYLMMEAFLGKEHVAGKFREKYDSWRVLIATLIARHVNGSNEAGGREAASLALAGGILALIDGLTLQWLLAPERVDVEAVAAAFAAAVAQ